MSRRRAWLIGVAALCVAPVSGVAMADTLGRLFYTPEQRARLERKDSGDAPAEDEQPVEPRRVDGLVRRSGGASTVWVDGEPVTVDPRKRGDGPKIDGDRVLVRGIDGRVVRLRPGETEGRQ